MTAYRPIDSKREEFRKYLERCGVMDALTKVLVLLYEEPDKPEDALEFVRVNLGDTRPSVAEIDAMKADLETALAKIQLLEEENCELKKKLAGEDGIASGTQPVEEESKVRESVGGDLASSDQTPGEDETVAPPE